MVDLIDFFEIANKLKWMPRSGWIVKVNVKEPESVADHSYLTVLMAMVLADMKHLDTTTVLRIAVLHDLAESITGDLMPEQMSKDEKQSKENAAMIEMLKRLPKDLSDTYTGLWKEYLRGSSEEALLVRQIDKLEMAFQARDYLRKGYHMDQIEEFFRSAEEEIKDKELINMLNSLRRVRG